MSSESNISSNTETKSLLLIGSNSINNQFVQREIEKKSGVVFDRKTPQEIELSAKVKTPDVVLVSHLILANMQDIQTALANVLSEKWIVYDVPNGTDERAIAEIDLTHLIHLKGIIYQDAPIEHLNRCLKTVLEGDFWLPRKVMAQMLMDARPYALRLQEAQSDLTKRELQVFKKLIEGASNLEISEDLYISESTVKTHIYKIYKKLKVTNRKEAIRKATQFAEIEFH